MHHLPAELLQLCERVDADFEFLFLPAYGDIHETRMRQTVFLTVFGKIFCSILDLHNMIISRDTMCPGNTYFGLELISTALKKPGQSSQTLDGVVFLAETDSDKFRLVKYQATLRRLQEFRSVLGRIYSNPRSPDDDDYVDIVRSRASRKSVLTRKPADVDPITLAGAQRLEITPVPTPRPTPKRCLITPAKQTSRTRHIIEGGGAGERVATTPKPSPAHTDATSTTTTKTGVASLSPKHLTASELTASVSASASTGSTSASAATTCPHSSNNNNNNTTINMNSTLPDPVLEAVSGPRRRRRGGSVLVTVSSPPARDVDLDGSGTVSEIDLL